MRSARVIGHLDLEGHMMSGWSKDWFVVKERVVLRLLRVQVISRATKEWKVGSAGFGAVGRKVVACWNEMFSYPVSNDDCLARVCESYKLNCVAALFPCRAELELFPRRIDLVHTYRINRRWHEFDLIGGHSRSRTAKSKQFPGWISIFKSIFACWSHLQRA